MKTIRRCLVVLLLCGLSWSGAYAQNAQSSGADVRLAIDVSGSMKANDPANLRASGIRLLVDLLPPQMRAGLWMFGSHVTNPLPMGTVDESWRRQALAVLPQLTDYQQFTDLEAALKGAAPPGQGDAARRTHIILLTDGMVDTPPRGADKAERDAASRQRLLDQLAPRLADKNVVVHTIALSQNADTALLRDLAQRTGGLAAVAETPEALLRAFLDVLDRVVPSEQVPLDEGRFSIDERVDEFTALIFHDAAAGPVTLVGPNGERINKDELGAGGDIRWRGDRRYDLITVPSPTPGEWHIDGQVGPGSRILIHSPLQLQTTAVPATVYQYFDVPIEAWLNLDGEPYDDANNAVTMRAELSDTDGHTISTVLQREADGHYRGAFTSPNLLGNARLRVLAEAGDFKRLQVQSVNVAPAIAATLAPDQSSITLAAAHPRLSDQNTTLTARLQGEELNVESLDTRHWLVDLPANLPEQSVAVTLEASVQLNGQTRRIPLPPVRLNEGAQVGLTGASLDRDQVDAQSLPDDANPQAQQDESWSLQRVWATLKPLWPQVGHYVREYGRQPWVWAIVGVLVLLWLIASINKRRRRRRRRRQRREPHV